MNENDKAAVAGGLWKQFSQSSWGEWRDEHGNLAPDMHDPRFLFSQDEIEARFKSLVEKYDAEHS